MAKAKKAAGKATEAKSARPKKAAKAAKTAAPKKAAGAKAPAQPAMPEVKKTLVGTIEHYYGAIGVAVVKASAPLRVGDEIWIERGEGSFKQKVDSMQVEHKPVSEVKAGDSFGLKVVQKATEGNKVYKLG